MGFLLPLLSFLLPSPESFKPVFLRTEQHRPPPCRGMCARRRAAGSGRAMEPPWDRLRSGLRRDRSRNSAVLGANGFQG